MDPGDRSHQQFLISHQSHRCAILPIDAIVGFESAGSDRQTITISDTRGGCIRACRGA
jgi:hypothetical protein